MAPYLHHVPGRLRIRLAGLKRNAGRAKALVAAMRAVPGVNSAEVNVLTGSRLVHYDASPSRFRTRQAFSFF